MGQEKANVVNEAVVKALGAFGGGIASTGRSCGALLGGVALISSLYSRGNLDEKEDHRMWRLSFKLAKKFEELTQAFGGINCRDIARVDWRDRNAVKEFYTHAEGRRKYCIQLVGDVAFCLGELLEQESAE
ncbi:MAG: C_GCAxxG_C_C family protein [Deltaproteobacteria bacterium]|nr:C_GCAxxG_C_C family protein [Deltaproteobacteria bacterium]